MTIWRVEVKTEIAPYERWTWSYPFELTVVEHWAFSVVAARLAAVDDPTKPIVRVIPGP